MKTYNSISLIGMIFFALYLNCPNDLHAQKNEKVESKSTEEVKDKVLLGNGAAFNRMVIQDITYAVIGENSPVSGIEIDLAKSEVTLSGMYPTKKSTILGFNLKAGGTERDYRIFSGFGNISSNFEASFVFNYIPKWSSAKFYPSKKHIADGKNLLLDKQKEAIIDTFYMAAMLYNFHIKEFKDLVENDPIPEIDSLSTNQKKILFSLVEKLTNVDLIGMTYENVHSYLGKVGVLKNLNGKVDSANIHTYNDKIINYYIKIKDKVRKYTKFDLLDEEIMDKKIANVSGLWTSKTNWWWSFTPIVGASKINLYRSEINGIDTNLFSNNYYTYGGASVFINWMKTIPKKRIFYFRGGLKGLYSNNIHTLKNFDYTSSNTLFSQNGVTTDVIVNGTSYKYSEFKQGFVTNIISEFYCLPLKSFAPGWYIHTTASFSEFYNLPSALNRGNDFFLMTLEIGGILNINNRSKSKNAVSISPYFRFEDITDSKRTSTSTKIKESVSDFYKRNLSFGFKIGIPISIQLNDD